MFPFWGYLALHGTWGLDEQNHIESAIKSAESSNVTEVIRELEKIKYQIKIEQQQLPPEKPPEIGKFVSVKELAEYHGIENKGALRKRLERFRKKNTMDSDAFREVQNAGVRDSRYLYNTEMVSGIIENLKRTQTSPKRPSKRKEKD